MMVKQCNRKAFARVRIKTGITSEANLPQAMALQGETASREILTWSLISLYAITERARTTKTGILDNRRIMSLSLQLSATHPSPRRLAAADVRSFPVTTVF
jgi:hypothetical protein